MPSFRQLSDLDLPKSKPRLPGQDAQPMNFAWLEECAVRYASRRETTEMRVSTLLERKIHERCGRTSERAEPTLEMIPAVVARLVERHFVNDQRFAEVSLERQRRQGKSTAYIRMSLIGKGIPEPLLQRILSNEAPDVESNAAWRYAERRRLGPYCRDPEERERSRQRHLSSMSRAGFGDETALGIIDATSPPPDSDLA